MTIAELMAELSKYPPTTEIVFTDDETLDEFNVEGIYFTDANEEEMVSAYLDIKLNMELTR